MQRITISVPEYLYENLVQQIPAGKLSRFAAQALEKELMKFNTNPIEEFVKLRKVLPKKKKGEILRAIQKERI